MGPKTARALGLFAALVIRVWRRLYRVESVGWERVLEARKGDVPLVFSLWHGELLAPILFHVREGIVTMASRSTDGEIIATMLRSIDYRAARGSTGKGGRAALEEMIEIMRSEKRDGALTVDGPRGPSRVVQAGVVRLARATGAKVVPVGSASRKNRRLRSWDRFLVPLPFDRVWIVHDPPMEIATEWSEPEACERIGAAIDEATRKAEILAGRG